MNRLFTALILVGVVSVGHAANWQLIGIGGPLKFYVEQPATTQPASKGQVRLLWDEERAPKGQSIVSSVLRYDYDCKSRFPFREVSEIQFSGHMATQPIGPDVKSPPQDFGALSWGEVIEKPLFDMLCASSKVPSAKSQTPKSVSFGSASSGPSEEAVARYIEQLTNDKSRGLVKFVSLKKTDGLARSTSGVSTYTMEWTAKLAVQQECWFHPDTFDANVGSQSDGILYASNRYQRFQRGALEMKGATRFRKYESGWRVM